MKQILKSVMDKLKSDIPELKYIGEDLGQLNTQQPAVKFPCALISIDSGQFNGTKDLSRRQVEIRLSVRVADDPSTIGSFSAPEAHKETAFLIFDVIDKVGDCLHGYKSEGCSALMEEEFSHFGREDNIREYGISFTTRYSRTLSKQS